MPPGSPRGRRGCALLWRDWAGSGSERGPGFVERGVEPAGAAIRALLRDFVGRSVAMAYLFMGGARDFLEGGHLFHFNLTGNRATIGVDDPRLEDRVADKNHKFDITESESLLIGRNFGVVTDISRR
jgi:hypothetical protein